MARLWVRMSLFTLLVLLGSGCDSRSGYSQSSPDAVIATAKLMVQRGDAARLPELFHAENDEMRSLFRRMGILLGNLQKLGTSVKAAFPAEIAKLESQAALAAKKGQATGLLSAITGNQQNPFARRRQGQSPEAAAQAAKKQEDAVNAAIKRLFANPYAFLEDGAGRLSTAYVSDDVAAVQWDRQPILPPVGLTMKRVERGGTTRWEIVLPFNLPGMARFTPRTKDEYKVLGSLMKTLDNVVVDLTRDVEERRLTSLDALSRKAGEKLLIPAAMTFYAYDRAVRARAKAAPPAPATPAVGPG